MSSDNQPRFKVGETYASNRRGNFTVIKLLADEMTVKWEDGETTTLSAREMEQICSNYEDELIDRL